MRVRDTNDCFYWYDHPSGVKEVVGPQGTPSPPGDTETPSGHHQDTTRTPAATGGGARIRAISALFIDFRGTSSRKCDPTQTAHNTSEARWNRGTLAIPNRRCNHSSRARETIGMRQLPHTPVKLGGSSDGACDRTLTKGTCINTCTTFRVIRRLGVRSHRDTFGRIPLGHKWHHRDITRTPDATPAANRTGQKEHVS